MGVMKVQKQMKDCKIKMFPTRKINSDNCKQKFKKLAIC